MNEGTIDQESPILPDDRPLADVATLMEVPNSPRTPATKERVAAVSAAARIAPVCTCQMHTNFYYSLSTAEGAEHVFVSKLRNYPKGPDATFLKKVLGDGVITAEGAEHIKQRRGLQPSFTGPAISSYADCMVEMTLRARGKWHDGQNLEMMHEMLDITLRIIVELLCGVDLDSGTDDSAEGLRTGFAAFNNQADTLLPGTHRALTDFEETLSKLIESRRHGEPKKDLISVMLRIQKNDPTMTDQLIRDQIMTLFFAGHETTASVLTWAWYLLGSNPAKEAKLHRELDEVLEGRPPTLEDVPKLKYATMVFAETMRLYPPVWGIFRQSVNEDAVLGYRIPADSKIIVAPYAIQRDPRWFPDPESFEPERFDPEADLLKKIHRFAYIPFGAGIRTCMGENFAWLEGPLLLATIAQQYRLRLDPSRVVAPHAKITLRPKFGLHVILKKRR